MMEKYKEKIEKLNEDPEFIEVVSKEKDAELVYNSLITEGYEQRTIEIAKNMLNKGMDISTISECTGLSKEEIEELKWKLKFFYFLILRIDFNRNLLVSFFLV